LLAGIFIGSMLGVATALALELKDPLVRGDSDVEELSGVPILVTLGSMKPQDGGGKGGSVSTSRSPATI